MRVIWLRYHQAERPVAIRHFPKVSVLGVPRSGHKVLAQAVHDLLLGIWLEKRPHIDCEARISGSSSASGRFQNDSKNPSTQSLGVGTRSIVT